MTLAIYTLSNISQTSSTQCENCGATDKKLWKCSRCFFESYCIECKKDHKFSHKKLCKIKSSLLSHFKTSEVDWKKIVKSDEKMNEMFSLEELHVKRTEALLQSLDVKSAISVLVSKLSGYHLRLLSNDQLQSPDFPWEEVAKSDEKITEMFYLGFKKETKAKLRLLDVKSVISVIFPKLSGYHLRLLSKRQLQSPDFPWKDVVESEEKIESLFSMSGSDSSQYRTVEILDLLDVKSTLRALINKFDKNLIAYLSSKQLESPDFPWDEVVKSERNIYMIFPLFEGYTKKLLQSLDVKSAISVLLPKLSGEHLRLLSEKQLRSPDFPWDEIEKSEEKKEALSYKRWILFERA